MAYQGGKRRTFRKREPKEFEEQVIQISRVTRVVKGGRKLRFRATVAIGNKKGKVGIGIGKSHEVTGAIQKAIAQAKKEMITVKLDQSTIPHEVKVKFKAAKILLMPAGPGTGIIAGGTIRKVLELTGVKDILSKSFGTTNKINITRATMEALGSLRVTPGMAKRKLAAAKKAEAAKPQAKKPQGKKAEAKKTEPKKPEVKKEEPKAEKEAPAKKTEPKKEESK
jgi:small subunit ribosomal protein S5